MTTNRSICIPTFPLLLHSNNNNINKIHSLSFPLSGFKQNTTPFRFQCRCINEENHRQIKTFGMYIKQFRQLMVPHQLPLIFPKLFFSSKKTEPENVSLDQLIGMDTAISQMRKILKRLQGSAEYERMNVKVPSGILIHGPNRTGKSSLVHALAREAKLPFFVVQGKEIEKNPQMILSLFCEARVSSPSIIYIEGIEVITGTGVSQLLDQMENCEEDGDAIVVIGTTDNVKTLVKDIKDGFDMPVHLGKPDMLSRTKMVDRLMKDYVLLEDRDKICKYIASETSGMVWKNIKAICNECCAHLIEERETAIGVYSWVTFEDVTKTLQNSDRITMLREKDATGKEDGTIVC